MDTLAALAKVVGGELHGADAPFTGVGTDTRTLGAGELFVALRGPRFDGNAFVAGAARAGAAGALVERHADLELGQVVVDDARKALGRYAHHWRLRHELPLVGVTGSNGKTTVKEMLAAILRQEGETLSTAGNLNNDIGVPLTLLRLRPHHRAAVIEMGANHAGEIAHLAALAAPRVGLVNNAGPAHLEGFGSIEGVAHAKGELYRALPADGVAVINLDDRYAPLWQGFATCEGRIGFGTAPQADFRVDDVRLDADGLDLSLASPLGPLRCRLPLPGRHNALNAAAAAAAAHAAGAGREAIIAGLAATPAVDGRLRLRPARAGARLIDDTYNANPASARAAMELLVARPGRHWLVLGDMGELGSDGERMHADVGAAARELGVERLYAVGELSRAAAAAFGEGAQCCDDVETLAERLLAELEPQVTVLLKASRAMRFERIGDALSLAPPGA